MLQVCDCAPVPPEAKFLDGRKMGPLSPVTYCTLSQVCVSPHGLPLFKLVVTSTFEQTSSETEATLLYEESLRSSSTWMATPINLSPGERLLMPDDLSHHHTVELSVGQVLSH